MAEKVSKEEFERAVMLNDSKELKKALDKFVIAATAPKKEDGTAQAIEKIADKVEGFVNAIKSLPKPDAPEVNLSVNQSQVVDAVNKMGTDILEELKELREALNIQKPAKEWKFDVKRNYSGYIESVVATATINKPKAQA